MENLIEDSKGYHFRVNGGEPRSSCIMVLLILGTTTLALLAGSAALVTGGTLAWAAVPATFAIILGTFSLVLRAGRRGRWAPFEIHIAPTAGTIRALNRRSGEVLWCESFVPERLYLAPLRMGAGDARTPRTALAYSHEPHAPVAEESPSPEHCVLATGPEAQLYDKAKEIQEAWDRAHADVS